MMAITTCLGCSTECFLLVLFATGLSILSPVWCQRCNTNKGEPQINISSTPPSNKLSIGAVIYLTCIAWQTDEMVKEDKNTEPSKIDWFDPQDKPIGTRCKAGSTPARPLKCPLEVGALTDGNLGNYTCRARNGYHYCSTKRFQVHRQQGAPQINISSTPPSNKFLIGAAIYLTCIAWQTDEMVKEDKNTGPSIIDWFDPQDKPIGTRCKAGSTPARPLKCPLEVGALSDGKLGNYTCRASNGYNYCSTKVFQVDRQQYEIKESTPAALSVEGKEGPKIIETTSTTVVFRPSTASKKKNGEIIAISVTLSVAIMFLAAVSVFLQYFRGRRPRDQILLPTVEQTLM